MKLLLLIISLIFFSCSPEGLHMSFMLDDSKSYLPTNVDDIDLYLESPDFDYEIIAYVEGSSGDYFSEKKNLDAALKALKKEAALIGAAGLIIDDKSLSVDGVIGSMFGDSKLDDTSFSLLRSTFSGIFSGILMKSVHLEAKAIYYSK